MDLSRRLGTAVVGSLVAWLAFVLAADARSAGLLSLPFVALPALLAILSGHTARAQFLLTVVMIAAAAYAGVQVAGSDDAQAGLAVLWVPIVALPLALVVWVGGAALRRNDRLPGPARPTDRLAALAVDALLACAAVTGPVVVLSNAKAEVAAAVVGLALAALYFAAPTALLGRTPGQALLGLILVDHASGGLVTPGRALLRSLVLVVELLGASWLLLLPLALAELVAVIASGRSLTDRLFRTSVVAAP